MMNYDTLSSFSNYSGKPTICCKVDAITIVFENCSIVDVLTVIGVTDVLTPDFCDIFSRRYLHSFGYAADVKFSFDGIGIQSRVHEVLNAFDLRHLDLLDTIDPIEFFNKPLGYIRLDLMGKALDYLRSSGIDIDSLVFVPLDSKLPPDAAYHYTRLDFAYDLLDYKPQFLKLCKTACHLYESPNHRLSITGSDTGVSWSERNGDQDTLYLGKPAGNKLLRIYDKKLQFDQANRYLTDSPYFYNDDSGVKIVPSSWIRIELQTRREKDCHNLLFGKNASFLSIFKFIYEHYAIKEGQGLNVPICDFWTDLFDWNYIPSIIQNANCAVYVNPFERASNYISGCALGPIMQVYAQIGPRAFIIWMEQQLAFMQSQPVGSSVNRRLNRILDKILFSNHGTFPEYLIKDSRSGELTFKRDFADLVPLSEVHYL